MSAAFGERAVKQAYREHKGTSELRGDWPAYVVFRPLSFWLTPAVLRLGLRATHVTALALGVAVVLPWAAYRGGWAWVCGLGFAFQLLDCVDGNVARARREVSATGDYLSMLVGQAYWVSLLWAFGILAAGDVPAAWAQHMPSLGILLGCLTVLGRLCREYVARLRSEAPLAAASHAARWGPVAWARIIAVGLDNAYIGILATAALLGCVGPAFMGVAIYVLMLFGVMQWELVRALG